MDSLGILLAWRFFIYAKKFFYIREKKAALAYKKLCALGLYLRNLPIPPIAGV